MFVLILARCVKIINNDKKKVVCSVFLMLFYVFILVSCSNCSCFL